MCLCAVMNVVVPAAARRQKSCFSPKSSPFALQTGTKWLCRVLWKSEQNYSGFANPKSWVLVRNVIPAATSHHHVMGASLVSVGPGGLCIETLAFEIFWDCQVKPTASDFIWRTSGFMCTIVEERANQQFIEQVTHWSLPWVPLSDRFQMQLQLQCLWALPGRYRILGSFQDWPCGFCKLKGLKPLSFLAWRWQICGPCKLSKEMPTRFWYATYLS